MDEAGRLGVEQAATATTPSAQGELFPAPATEPRFVEIDRTRVRVENCRQFGGPWLALELVKKLGLHDFLKRTLQPQRERVPWSLTSLILIVARLCEPSSELRIAEHFYRHSALPDLLGVPVDRVDDNRLYRGLDKLLPHKEELEKFLKERFGELFAIEYDLLLYDVTSTYFEGQAKANSKAQRGYSRDHRPDCKQVCIGLVVTRCGLPLGYQVFAGNRHDSTTLQEIVTAMEGRYGKAQRIWGLDRGMVSEENLDFLKAGGQQYIVGTPKAQLKRFERELLAGDWRKIRDGLEVKLCQCPNGGSETFVLCRSRDRRAKEQAMHARFERRIEEGLTKIAAGCQKRVQATGVIERRVGKLLGQNTRAAGLFDVKIAADAHGAAQVAWTKVDSWRAWAQLSEGSYVLRTNVTDWSDEDLWRAYIHLTDAEAAFRIQKSDLSLRPVWHQKEDRVDAHILVCFLAFVLWKFLGQLCQRAGLGDEPRRVLDELSELRSVDVILPTKDGIELRTRCVTQPSDHQRILLQHLGLDLPTRLNLTPM
jgi:transposase